MPHTKEILGLTPGRGEVRSVTFEAIRPGFIQITVYVGEKPISVDVAIVELLDAIKSVDPTALGG